MKPLHCLVVLCFSYFHIAIGFEGSGLYNDDLQERGDLGIPTDYAGLESSLPLHNDFQDTPTDVQSSSSDTTKDVRELEDSLEAESNFEVGPTQSAAQLGLEPSEAEARDEISDSLDADSHFLVQESDIIIDNSAVESDHVQGTPEAESDPVQGTTQPESDAVLDTPEYDAEPELHEGKSDPVHDTTAIESDPTLNTMPVDYTSVENGDTTGDDPTQVFPSDNIAPDNTEDTTMNAFHSETDYDDFGAKDYYDEAVYNLLSLQDGDTAEGSAEGEGRFLLEQSAEGFGSEGGIGDLESNGDSFDGPFAVDITCHRSHCQLGIFPVHVSPANYSVTLTDLEVQEETHEVFQGEVDGDNNITLTLEPVTRGREYAVCVTHLGFQFKHCQDLSVPVTVSASDLQVVTSLTAVTLTGPLLAANNLSLAVNINGEVVAVSRPGGEGEVVVGDLLPGTEYAIKVAVEQGSDSQISWEDEESVRVSTEALPPPASVSVEFESGQLHLSWQYPEAFSLLEEPNKGAKIALFPRIREKRSADDAADPSESPGAKFLEVVHPTTTLTLPLAQVLENISDEEQERVGGVEVELRTFYRHVISSPVQAGQVDIPVIIPLGPEPGLSESEDPTLPVEFSNEDLEEEAVLSVHPELEKDPELSVDAELEADEDPLLSVGVELEDGWDPMDVEAGGVEAGIPELELSEDAAVRAEDGEDGGRNWWGTKEIALVSGLGSLLVVYIIFTVYCLRVARRKGTYTVRDPEDKFSQRKFSEYNTLLSSLAQETNKDKKLESHSQWTSEISLMRQVEVTMSSTLTLDRLDDEDNSVLFCGMDEDGSFIGDYIEQNNPNFTSSQLFLDEQFYSNLKQQPDIKL